VIAAIPEETATTACPGNVFDLLLQCSIVGLLIRVHMW
jgi:hypothetical protein